jgi:hypothetical protein
MSNEYIYNKWNVFITDDKYKEHFLDNNTIWEQHLNKVKIYIDENNKRPTNNDKNIDIKQLGAWISTQNTIFKNKKEIITNKEIYIKWNVFITDDKYKEYFLDNNTIWKQHLEKVKQYIDKNNKRLSRNDKDKNIKRLGSWVSTQTQNFKKKTEIMSNEEIYNKWNDFITDDKYKEYF